MPDDLTLTGSGGAAVTLFAPRSRGEGLEAHAVYVARALPRPRTLNDKTSKKRFRVPAMPEGFHLAHVIFPEAE